MKIIKKLKAKIKAWWRRHIVAPVPPGQEDMFDEWNPNQNNDENPDHTVWTVEVEKISNVFATEAEAQKYVDKMNKKKIFKVKKLDVNPANLKPYKPKQR